MKHWLLLLLGGVSSTPALAQSFTLTSSTPARNAVAAPRTQALSITLSQPVGAGAAQVRVFSSRRGGRLSGTPTVSGNTLTFTPAQALVPGEQVSVTLPGTLQSTAGVPLAAPQVYQFTAATAPGPGTFIGNTAVTVGNTAATGRASSLRDMHTADIDNDGDLDLLTANSDYDPGTVSVRLNNGAGRFSGTTNVAVGALPYQIITADIDTDGDLDLITRNATNVSVRLNTGQGAFAPSTTNLTVGVRPSSMVCGDIDGDGDLDLLTSNEGDRTVSALLNNGQGEFTLVPSITGVSNIILGDLDSDGDLDMVVREVAAFAGVTVRLNNGSGTFSSTPINVTPMHLAGVYEMQVADMNGDGKLDIVVAESTGTYWFANSGAASFGSPQLASTTSGVAVLQATDVDGDGDLDLLAVDSSPAINTKINMLLNNGSGTFSPGPSLTMPSRVQTVEMADLDGDGDLDLLESGSGFTDQVQIRFNQVPASLLAVTGVTPGRNARNAARTGTVVATFSQPLATPPATEARLHLFSAQQGGRRAGQTTAQGSALTFTPAGQLQAGERVAVTITATDPTGNTRLTRPEVVEFTTAVAGGTGLFGGGTRLPAAQFTDYMAAADLDGDADLDLVTATGISEQTTEIEVWRNEGNGTYSARPRLVVGGDLSGLITADIDGDGDLDVVASTGRYGYTASPGRISVCLNNGQGTFSVRPPLEIGVLPQDLIAGDVDGDGDLDLLTATASNGLGLSRNRGDGTFEPLVAQSGTSLERILLGDVDSDGDLDLLTTNPSAVGVCLNDGTGTFAARQSISAANRGALATGDLDGDGDLDLLTSNGSAVSVSLNDGAGQFSSGSTVAVLGGIFGYRHLAIGDVDNDGDLDLLSGGGSLGGQVSVRLNNGAGVFSGGSDPTVGINLSAPAKVLLLDTDRDGDLDLVAANYATGGVVVQLNDGSGPVLSATGATATATPLAVYPNPAHQTAWVDIPSGSQHLRLLNALGQQLRLLPVAGRTRVALEVGGLPAGLYFVQVGAAVQRLVVE